MYGLLLFDDKLLEFAELTKRYVTKRYAQDCYIISCKTSQ